MTILKFPTLRLKAWAYFVIFSFLLLSAAYVLGESSPGTEVVGDEVCSACHDEISEAFKGNIHARLSVGDGNTCESCHGPGSLHAEEGDAATIINPARDHTSTGINLCLNCHKGIDFTSWLGSTHYEMAEGCSDCHRVHSQKKNLLAKPQPQLCFGCHADKMVQARMPSHHPILEGMITCVDCHSPHSGEIKHTLGDNGRELCLSCHSSLEGPFIFEHDPVNEDCNICHDPHGTVADKMLVQNEPFLCLSCHSMHFHTTLLGVEGNFSANLHPERGGLSTKEGLKKAFLTKCTQCHSEIHGSDLPSQSTSGAGEALTR